MSQASATAASPAVIEGDTFDPAPPNWSFIIVVSVGALLLGVVLWKQLK